MFIDGKKGSLILILKVLEEYSDNDHYLTQQDIINKISSLYGLELERKTIGANINLLIELGYDIVKKEKGGYCLLSILSFMVLKSASKSFSSFSIRVLSFSGKNL